MKPIIVIAATAILVITFSLILLRYFKWNQSQVKMVPLESSPAIATGNRRPNAPAPNRFDAIHWAQINSWQVEAQTNDRKQMNASVPVGIGSASSRRAGARQMHQVMYKQWSQERHD